MYLKSMKLQNFRCFSDLEINFQERITVLVGDNGAGKSTVLEAAAIAVGTLTSAMDGITNYGIRKTDAYYKYFEVGSVVDVQSQFPVEISAEGTIDGKSVHWRRTLNSAKGRGGFAGAKELTEVASDYQNRLRMGDTTIMLPIVSYYGTGRLWDQHREKRTILLKKILEVMVILIVLMVQQMIS